MQKDAAKKIRRHLVAAVVFDGVSPFEFAVACEVFGIDRTKDVGVPWYRFLVCAAGPTPVRAGTGFTIGTSHGLEALRRADTILVPAGEGEKNEELLDALRRAHKRGARIMSVCTGAFVLAAAGLLDGRRATTHWAHAAELSRRYPLVQVDPDVLYVDDGDILTSAGTAAGIDLCLYVVRLDYGAEAANIVARRMVVPPHRDGGQAQFVAQPLPEVSLACDPFTEALAWALEHLEEDLSIGQLAARAAMSPRTFARRFGDTHGTTPHQWLLRQRVLLAQRLLETTDLGVEQVAARCGMGTAANLRQHFQRIVRNTPQGYRRCFQQGCGQPERPPHGVGVEAAV
ncbi:MAG TPA: helix-turn-helix domain-containing protein [Acidimicrobiales bacterium]|nr:helix-turn-helix domain-containing protein [Acidimicrobiales bacterium]